MKNNFEIRGDHAAIFLPRKNGTFLECLIDASDMIIAMETPGTIYAAWNPSSGIFYAAYHETTNGKQKTLFFHHRILAVSKGAHVDHIDRNGLNNRQLNLRRTTPTRNNLNRRNLMSRNTSGLKGVHRHKESGRWRAQIGFNGKIVSLGLFNTKEEAKVAYDAKLAELDPIHSSR